MQSDDLLRTVLGRTLEEGTLRMLAALAVLSIVGGTIAYFVA